MNVVLWIISFLTLWLTLVWLNYLYYLPPRANSSFKPKVSLLVPAFNESECILRTLKSLVSSSYKNKEIIVVDDGSSDNTASIVSSFIKSHKGVKLVKKVNGGKASALNAGLAVASGEIIGVVDADSRISKTAINKMLHHFVESNTAAVISRIRVDNADSLLTRMQRFEYIMSSLTRKIMNNFGTLWMTPGVLSLYRASALRKVGGFTKDKGNLTEDLEIAMRLRYNGFDLKMEPNAVTYTNVPVSLSELWRQRMRWTRGYLFNHWKYRDMIMNKKHGLFGTFMLPVNVLAIVLLVANVSIISFELFDRWIEYAIRSATIPGYFIDSWTNLPSLKEFVLANNVQVILPLLLVFFIGIHLILYAHRFFRESLKDNFKVIIAYMIVIPYFAALNWVASIAEEFAGRRRKW